MSAAARGALAGVVLLCSAALNAQETVVKLDPAGSTVHYTLGATLHTVHGTFKMKSGEIRFDSATGKASGSIAIDATSGDSGNGSRDHNMHANVIESAKYPEIVFSPSAITPAAGRTLKEIVDGKASEPLQASGIFRLHGQDHEVTLDLTAENDGSGHVHIAGQFPVPYVKWGLKNPSTFLLKVSDTVQLEIDATGQILGSR